MDCEKLVQEKTEMQRHYVMVSEMFSQKQRCLFATIVFLFCSQLFISYDFFVLKQFYVSSTMRCHTV